MRSNIIAVALLVLICSLTCVGDQLQWNSLSVCEKAVHMIRQDPVLVSYCSLADEEYVEVWLVKEADVVATAAEGLFEVIISGERLYRSRKVVRSGDSREPIDYVRVKGEGDSEGWFIVGIDLAYVYMHTGESVFRCVGELLELQHFAELDTIILPGKVMNKIKNMG